MRDWICPDCGHEVMADERPSPIKWTDGHMCRFVERKEDESIPNVGQFIHRQSLNEENGR